MISQAWGFFPRERFLNPPSGSPPLLSIFYIAIIGHVAAAPGPVAAALGPLSVLASALGPEIVLT